MGTSMLKLATSSKFNML